MYGMEQAKEARMPLAVPLIGMNGEGYETIVTNYQQLGGQLLYISTIVRPDVARAAATRSRYICMLGEVHWNATVSVLRYLEKTKTYVLCLGRLSEEAIAKYELKRFVDSDYATDKDTRRSRTRYLFLFNGSLVSWYNKLQTTIACGIVEVQYMAITACVKEGLWLRNLMGSLLDKSWNNIQIYNDN